MTDVSWPGAGLCAQTDPGVFYPEPGEPADTAKRICTLCPVRLPCLEYALATGEQYGIWGGLSANQRHHLRRGIPGTAASAAGDRRCS
ncbi:WhiB family transcriptional regulator [Pseudonocardia sp. ICBG1293]|nr:WhiB family transcriptional regulator [Pseudonocardia sp. ICBG1293]